MAFRRSFCVFLLDSVRKEDMPVESLSWQLGKKVITNCADKLKPYLMEAMKSLGFVFVLDDYAPIIASTCKEIASVTKQQSPSASHEPVVDTSKSEETSSIWHFDSLETVIEVASPPKATPIVNSITSPDSLLEIEKINFIGVNNFELFRDP
ncbi:hypothetical protein L1049_011503 [Liquidambar formosana]|uniref:Uncharacterized protein n=1 Tax=Liquidambar formosana TaxID=63359 RepID=A0AAP0WY62_LIQFO